MINRQPVRHLQPPRRTARQAGHWGRCRVAGQIDDHFATQL